MKRWGILLCLLLTLSLTACGGGNSAAQNTPAGNTGAGSADPNVPAEPAGEVLISLEDEDLDQDAPQR